MNDERRTTNDERQNDEPQANTVLVRNIVQLIYIVEYGYIAIVHLRFHCVLHPRWYYKMQDYGFDEAHEESRIQ